MATPLRRLGPAPLLLAVLATCMLVHKPAAARTLAQAASPAAAPAVAAAEGSQADAQLLLAFKASLDNGNEILQDWRPGTDPCAWTGISCKPDGSVDSLVLMDKGIRGAIPQPDGWKLPPTITDISLGNNNKPPTNQLRGPLPPNWELPPRLNLLFLGFQNIGGTLPPSLKIPSTLLYLLMESSNLTGPLPPWPLPSVQSINLIGNQLTGGIPDEWTKLPSLAIMSLQNNQLNGSLPSSMTFNQSFGVNALSVDGNNFSGRLPSWPDQPTSLLSIHPGNEGLCGAIPKSPLLLESSDGTNTYVTSMPPCPGDPTDSSGGLSGGAIAGIVIGCVAAGAVTLVGAAWLLRRRRQQATTQDAISKQGSLPMSLDSLKGFPPSSTGQLPTPFNPFAAGPKVRSEPTSTGSSGNRTVPLTALRSSGALPSSSTPAAQQAKVQAKLEALYQEKPAWLISPSRLTLEQGPDGQFVLLGSGAYGRVYKGFLQPEAPAEPQPADADAAQPAGNGTSAAAQAIGQAPISRSDAPELLPVAVKVMDAVNVSAFLQEAALMTRLADGPHVVALHGACVDDQALVVVMELMEGGDLRTLLSSEEAPQWSTGGRQIALDIAEGLVFLHARNVTHRDLKSKNVLMGKDGRAKISDVGTAAMHSATFLSAGSSNFGGTLAWAAPELLLGGHISHRSDCYSLGVVLWELVTKRIPRRGDVAPPPPSEDCPAGLSELIGECLQLEPAQRPTAEQVLERLKAL